MRPPPCRYCASLSAVSTRTNRRTETFSPSFCTSAWRACSTLPPFADNAESAAMSAGSLSTMSPASVFANATKSWLRATKSVSQFTSTMAPVLASGDIAAPMTPSAAIRSAALVALAPPLMRSSSSALAISPCVSVNAFLHSIMPMPVRARSSITLLAAISPMLRHSTFCSASVRRLLHASSADKKRGPQPRFCVLHRRFVPGYFDKLLGRHNFLDDLALAFENGIGHATRVKANSPARIVVAGDDIGDAVGRMIRIHHADDRNRKLVRLRHRDFLITDIDDEQRIRQR